MVRWLAVVLLLPRLAWGAELGGSWEIQSMGSDRAVEVQQRGDMLIAHRVMWPTFEGQKYKLEHLYRGKISGKAVHGELLVKEEGAADYEILRSFDGSIASNDSMDLDGQPMKRTGSGAKAEAATEEPAEESVAAAPAPAAPAPSPPAPSPAPEPSAPKADLPGAGLFDRIMSSPGMEDLFADALKVAIPEEVAALTRDGDALFAKGKYEAALAKFDEASTTGGGLDPQLLHRKGRCQLKLKRWAAAKESLRAALKLDPSNKQVRRDYNKAKQRAR